MVAPPDDVILWMVAWLDVSLSLNPALMSVRAERLSNVSASAAVMSGQVEPPSKLLGLNKAVDEYVAGVTAATIEPPVDAEKSV